MQKIKKLILTTGIFSSSLFFNPGYAQEKEYYVGDPTYSEKEIKKVDKETFWKIAKDNNHYRSGMEEEVNKSNLTKWYVVPGDDKNGGFRASGSTPKTTQSYKAGSYQATPNSQVKFKSSTTKTTYQTTRPQNKPTRENNYYIPPKTNNNSDLGKAILTTGAIIGGTYLVESLIDELLKPREKAPVYNSPPGNNPPMNYNSNSKDNVDWWKENKENANWWEEKQKQEKIEDKIFWEEDKTKSENLLEKKIKETEIKKLWDEEVKKANEFFKEKEDYTGLSKDNKYYKIVGTIEIGPNGEIIKKESQRQEREITDEEKVILYYTDWVVRNRTPAGPVLEGIDKYDKLKKEDEWNEKYEESKKIIGQPEEGAPENSFYYGTTKFQKDMKTGLYVAGEKFGLVGKIEGAIDLEKKIREESVKNWLNQQIKEEKEVDFLFAKPIGDNTYYYFKLAGKEELYKNYNESSKLASYIAIKNSPYGDQIINIAKDFKEKVEKVENWWDK